MILALLIIQKMAKGRIAKNVGLKEKRNTGNQAFGIQNNVGIVILTK